MNTEGLSSTEVFRQIRKLPLEEKVILVNKIDKNSVIAVRKLIDIYFEILNKYENESNIPMEIKYKYDLGSTKCIVCKSIPSTKWYDNCPKCIHIIYTFLNGHSETVSCLRDSSYLFNNDNSYMHHESIKERINFLRKLLYTYYKIRKEVENAKTEEVCKNDN